MTVKRPLLFVGACLPAMRDVLLRRARRITGKQAPAFLAATLLLAPLARADLEFTGILITPQSAVFAVRDTAAARTEWRAIGERFAGYTVARFDREKDTLVLSKDGAELVLRLKDDAKIKSVQLELRGKVTLGVGNKLDVIRASLRFDEENVFPLQDGITCRMTPRRLPDGNLLFEIAVDRTVAPNAVKRISGSRVIARPDGPFELHVGDLVFAFAPQAG